MVLLEHGFRNDPLLKASYIAFEKCQLSFRIDPLLEENVEFYTQRVLRSFLLHSLYFLPPCRNRVTIVLQQFLYFLPQRSIQPPMTFLKE
jgi:hypothetical protein